VLSDEILELYDKLQSDQQLATDTEQQHTFAQAELEKLTVHIAQQRETLEFDIGRLQTELSVAEQQLPAELKPDYERMVKARGEDAMAPIEENVCAGCYHNITPQMINELALSRIVFCKSCGRLLYTPEDSQP
jgi:predicted  nucleic acid-binding Zn-ribbon protein